jgi:hypothetical protein
MRPDTRLSAPLRVQRREYDVGRGTDPLERRRPVAMLAMAIPILPGKTDAWHAFIEELNGPRKADFDASRRRLGVRERTFFQETPMG